MRRYDPKSRRPGDVVLDNLPEGVLETRDDRAARLRELAAENDGLESVVVDVERWAPGQAVTVAFHGGGAALHADVVEATRQITEACNLVLDFGLTPEGTYRAWSPLDTEYGADIRVSFDQDGYFSLVGTESIDPTIGRLGDPVGGRPGQRSLNLGAFEHDRPDDWRGVVRHEFLHALGFHHEHQNLRGPCEVDFRWDDDAGYVRTTDDRGGCIADAHGRRPGIYTFLSGAPNHWDRAYVDFNLRAAAVAGALVGDFDRESVMLYRFPASFYKTEDAQCAPTGDGITLSAGDLLALQTMYPGGADDVAAILARRESTIHVLAGAIPEDESPGLESARDEPYAETALRILRRSVARP